MSEADVMKAIVDAIVFLCVTFIVLAVVAIFFIISIWGELKREDNDFKKRRGK